MYKQTDRQTNILVYGVAAQLKIIGHRDSQTLTYLAIDVFLRFLRFCKFSG